MQKSKTHNHHKATLIAIPIGIVLIVVAISSILWWSFSAGNLKRGVVEGNQQSDVRTHDDWLTYHADDMPFIFDYPNSLAFEKHVEKINEPRTARTSFARGTYTLITLQGNDKNSAEEVLKVQYRDGVSQLSDGASVCREGNAETTTVENSYITGAVRVCGLSKEWKSENMERKSISMYSPEGMDLSTFKQIVTSIREK